MSSMQRDAQLTKASLINALRACNESGEDVLAAYGIVINTVCRRILIFFNSGARCKGTAVQPEGGADRIGVLRIS